MNGTDLFELMDNIEDKYIADARIKHRAYVFAAKENGVSAFFKNAVLPREKGEAPPTFQRERR